jgi:sulfur-oxidizing protein SoxX
MQSFPWTGRAAAGLLAGTLALAGVGAWADAPQLKLAGSAESGKKIAMDRGKGNCIACHIIPGGESPGAIGPALIAMQTRYPSKQALFVQIWDATAKNPAVVMPPFGRHEILSEQELADVTEFIWSL